MDQTAGFPGPDERFSALYAQHAENLVAYCRRRVGPAEAEEIAQEAFLRAWASWDDYSPSRPFWPWLVTIARRVCIDRGRRQSTAAALAHKTVSIFDGIPVTRPDEIVEANEEYALARTAAAALRPDQRRMLTRQAVDGWSYSKIASAEGVSEEVVRGVLRRARARLRAAYAELAGSAPVALPLAAFRWAKRRIATAPVFDFNMARAGEVAVAAAAVIAIGAGPAASAAPAALPASARQVVSAPTTERVRTSESAASSSHLGRAATQGTPVFSSATAARSPVSTVPGRPTKVKVAELDTPDDELARHCAEADIKVRVGDHGACVTTKKAVENAQILIDGGSVEP